jgi:hypothetical protein
MITPAGKECKYYHEDYHRGRDIQECRLLKGTRGPRWKPSDCNNCPVPEILWANASPHLVLEGEINAGLLGLGRRVIVEAHCRKHGIPIDDPRVGCMECAAERPNLNDLLDGVDL